METQLPLEGNEEVPVMSAERAQVIYTITRDALEDLSRRDLSAFRPVIEGETITSAPQEFNEIAEVLGWGLRVADSFGNQELVDDIRTTIGLQPSFEYFVIYQLLTDSFEAEGGYQIEQDFRLNPVTPALRQYALEVISRNILVMEWPAEWKMLLDILARVTAWLPLNPTPETYIGIYDIGPIFSSVEIRQKNNPVMDDGTIPDLFLISKYHSSINQYFRDNKNSMIQ